MRELVLHRRQGFAALRFVLFDVIQLRLQIFQLLLQQAAMVAECLNQAIHLYFGVLRRFVQIQNIFDFTQRQPQALAAQGQLQARALPIGLHAGASARAFTVRRQ